MYDAKRGYSDHQTLLLEQNDPGGYLTVHHRSYQGSPRPGTWREYCFRRVDAEDGVYVLTTVTRYEDGKDKQMRYVHPKIREEVQRHHPEITLMNADAAGREGSDPGRRE